eukprot:1067180-Amorphochlora_amoeboformis.AAC.1
MYFTGQGNIPQEDDLNDNDEDDDIAYSPSDRVLGPKDSVLSSKHDLLPPQTHLNPSVEAQSSAPRDSIRSDEKDQQIESEDISRPEVGDATTETAKESPAAFTKGEAEEKGEAFVENSEPTATAETNVEAETGVEDSENVAIEALDTKIQVEATGEGEADDMNVPAAEEEAEVTARIEDEVVSEAMDETTSEVMDAEAKSVIDINASSPESPDAKPDAKAVDELNVNENEEETEVTFKEEAVVEAKADATEVASVEHEATPDAKPKEILEPTSEAKFKEILEPTSEATPQAHQPSETKVEVEADADGSVAENTGEEGVDNAENKSGAAKAETAEAIEGEETPEVKHTEIPEPTPEAHPPSETIAKAEAGGSIAANIEDEGVDDAESKAGAPSGILSERVEDDPTVVEGEDQGDVSGVDGAHVGAVGAEERF